MYYAQMNSQHFLLFAKCVCVVVVGGVCVCVGGEPIFLYSRVNGWMEQVQGIPKD